MRKKKSGPRRAPVAVRLTEEMEKRLAVCAEKTKISKHSLAIEAIEAAVEAIERNDYRLVVPIEFTVTHVPAPAGKSEASATPGSKGVAGVGGRSSETTSPSRPESAFSLSETGTDPAPRLTDEPLKLGKGSRRKSREESEA